MGQFSNSFPKHFSYLYEYAIRFDLSCSFCEYPFIFHCLHCSPSCFDPDSLLLACLWLGLSWIDCISANKSFSSSKTSSRKPYTSSKQQERQKHSVEITINFSGREPRGGPESVAERPVKGHPRFCPRHGQGPSPPLPAVLPRDAPGGASSPLAGSPAALPSAQHAPHGGAFYSDGPEQIGHLSDGRARPQAEPSGLGGSPAPAEPPGGETQGPPTQAGNPQLEAHPGAVEGGAAS